MNHLPDFAKRAFHRPSEALLDHSPVGDCPVKDRSSAEEHAFLRVIVKNRIASAPRHDICTTERKNTTSLFTTDSFVR